MGLVKLLATVVLCGPPAVAIAGIGTLLLMVRFDIRSTLAVLGVIGLGASYLVPFSLVASAVGLGLAQWAMLTVHDDSAVAKMTGVFLTGVLLGCLVVILWLLIGKE